jgi:simple sugar transport system substrate-binding protein
LFGLKSTWSAGVSTALRLVVVALVAAALAGCGSGFASVSGGNAESGSPATANDDLTVGFVYIGARDDYGYNQAHADGAAEVKKLAGVKVIEEERVPDTTDVQKTMESMIALDGAKVVFPTSFGYFEPHVLVLAKKYPDVMFLHCGGLWNEQIHPKNVGSYFGYIDECQYLSGIVAGYTTHSKKIGFVAGKPIPQVLRNVNAFTLGARSVDPAIKCTVVFTGDWSLPLKEAEAANSLIDEGADVITCHVNSPKVVIETAERRGIFSCGYHTSQASLAPKGYLTGAEWCWGKVYTDYVTALKAGKKVSGLLRGGLKEGLVTTSPYGPAVSEKARAAADAVKAKLMQGSYVIYKGPLKDNAGKLVIPAGKAYAQNAIELESMDYLVEGASGR